MSDPNYTPTSPTYGDVMDDMLKFPTSVSVMCSRVTKMPYLITDPQPTEQGIIVAYYELKEVRELKTVTETVETVLDMTKYVT